MVLAVLAGGWIALGRLVVPPLLGWATVGALGFTLAGCVLHAGVNAPARGGAAFAVFAGVVTGVVGAALVSGTAVLIGLGALAAMIAYTRILEPRGLPGNLALAALAGLPLMYGALAVGRPAGGVVPWILASWLQLIRVMVSELDTESVDQRRIAAVLPAVLALAFIPVSLVLPARAGYGVAYFLLALFAQLAVLATAARLMVGRMDGVRQLLKGAMLMGAVAMVAGRVT